MTLVLELTDELEHQLREAAQAQDLTPEDVAISTLRAALGSGTTHRNRVKAAGDYVQRKNAELYRRLA